MTLYIKVFPITGLCDETQKLTITLEDGVFSKVLSHLQERFGTESLKTEALMFLHNGVALDRSKDIVFQDGDELWLMPLLSGG